MGLEEKITQGQLAYFDFAEFNAETKTLVIEFYRDPDHRVVYGMLKFEAVQNYGYEIDEDDREDFEAGLLIEDLLGITEQPLEDTTRYFINSDTREISFLSPAKPLWSLMSKNAEK